MEKLKMGIIGAGHIAHVMASTIVKIPEIQPYAVAAREKERADIFAREFGFEKAYGSYEELVQDENVDLVYVSTPHSHHYAHAKLCLQHGRPVLCEKAFTANATQAHELMDLSRQKKVFITEAIWTRYMPQAHLLHRLAQQQDAIGRISMMSANFGYSLMQKQRMTDPALAGGALLDLGVYTLTAASIAFGSDVEKVTSDAVLTPQGVDLMNSITLHYRDGRMACLATNMATAMPRTITLYGEDGYIQVKGPNNLEDILVYDKEGVLQTTYPRPAQISGYEYEVLACLRALRENRLECPEMPHAETLRIMEMMDAMRKEWGVRFPFE